MRRRLASLSSILLVGVSPLFAAAADDMPGILHHVQVEFSDPVWVAEELAVDARGDPDPALFSDYAIRSLGKYRRLERRAQDGCVELPAVIHCPSIEVGNRKSELALRRDLASGVELADWIFLGEVTGTAPGFRGSTPGTLVRLEPRKTFKGPRDRVGSYYVFLPVGEVSLGDVTLCKIDRRYPDLPRIGDRMLAMVELNAANSGQLLGVGFRFVVIRQDGTLAFPDGFDDLRRDLGRSGRLEDLERRVEQSIAGSAELDQEPAVAGSEIPPPRPWRPRAPWEVGHEGERREIEAASCADGGDRTALVVDLDADGLQLTGIDETVAFDLDADGTADQIGWTSADTLEGFLCMDRNRNGVIDDGRELFGSATRLMSGARAADGFSALAEVDFWRVGGNENGVVEPEDPLFSALRIWVDVDHDGISDEIELFRLEDVGLVAIELDFKEQSRFDEHGNHFVHVGSGWIERGSSEYRRVDVVGVNLVRVE